MRKQYLYPADPILDAGTKILTASYENLSVVPVYIWHAKEQDMIMSGLIEAGIEGEYVQSWKVRETRYAEVFIVDRGMVMLLEKHITPINDRN